MLRFFCAALFIVCFAFQIVADQSISLNGPLQVRDIQITLSGTTKIQSSMGSMGSMGGMGMGGMSASDSNSNPLSSNNNDQKLVFIMKSKNIGSQAISNIYWESCYTNSSKETVIKKFKSGKKIKANAEETIKESVAIDTKSTPATNKLGIHISKIEYDDKSVWEDSSKTDSPFIFVDVKFDKQ